MELGKCIEFIKEKHKNQTRKQGTPYYLHPVEVSNILKEKGFSLEYQIVGLFHDLLEDTDATVEEIRELSNDRVAYAVLLLTKEEEYDMSEYIGRIKENDMAKMVKLADRIHNLSEAHMASLDFQKKYIKETDEWFVDMVLDTVFEGDLNEVLVNLKDNLDIKKLFR